MTIQPPRSNLPYLYVAAAIVIVAVVISASVLALKIPISSASNTTATQTATSVTTLAQTSTSTVTVTGPTATSSITMTTTTLVSQTNTSSTSTVSTICSITGQPGPIFLRILSDSTQTPAVGALVMATNQPAFCGGSPATSQTTITFTTNDTEWYALSSDNNAGYSFVVRYTDQRFAFTANLAPVSATCATLFVPSGRTNITITEFQTSCK